MTGHDGFNWTPWPWGSSLRSTTLDEAADHLFTARQLMLRGPGEDAEWGLVAGAIGVCPERLARVAQVHGRAVVIVRRGEALPRTRDGWREADILLTDDPTAAVAVQVADCVPLLIADRCGRIAAAVHAGWRGTCAGAAGAAVRAIEEAFGVAAADLLVAQGPSIGPCCYVVGEEVVRAFAEAQPGADGRWFRRDEAGAVRLDLWAANAEQLEAAGVPAASIRRAGICTACHPELFHSYRRDGGGAGRMAAAIRPRGGLCGVPGRSAGQRRCRG
ncbi:MAG TPA: peptidoglycan editing factor PgeF [Vicinamibacterales bacterium]|nr:peptidoglycan editing factor PgeF [Vicinamibacterales bacterium]